MDYYGLLFLYYLKGLSGKSVLRLFFNIEAGGTEQLLPENTSTPTTTPILADIQYPDGLRTDQYFTYRETPTTVSNKARIKTIKGNTLVWNQQLNDTGSTTTTNGITFTKNADGSITLNGTATAQAEYSFARIDYVNGHKYLVKGIPSGATENGYKAFVFSRSLMENAIITTTRDDWFTPRIRVGEGVTVSNVVFRLNIFDLTKMFGEGNEPSTVDEFTSLFPSYYAYNAGTLLSFNGTVLKTVGFNQWDEEWELGNISADTGVNVSSSSLIRSKNYTPVFPNTLYYCHVGSSPGATFNIRARFYDAEKNYIGSGGIWWYNRTYTIPDNAHYMRFVMQDSYGTTYKNDICINISDTERNGQYEPYTSSTLSLPISTYFPTGMKSAGNVYDELMTTKAITRIGVLDLDSVNWTTTSNRAKSTVLNGVAKGVGTSLVPNMLSPKYDVVTAQTSLQAGQYAFFLNNGEWTLLFYYDGANKPTGLLYYELANPTETPITTEDANEALSLLMGKSVSSNNANQLINIITKGE